MTTIKPLHTNNHDNQNQTIDTPAEGSKCRRQGKRRMRRPLAIVAPLMAIATLSVSITAFSASVSAAEVGQPSTSIVRPLTTSSFAGTSGSQPVITSNILEEATGLYVNGNRIGVVKNAADLDRLLQNILETYNEEGATVSFLEQVELVDGLYPSATVLDVNVLRDILMGNASNTPISYVVKEGDTLEKIAEQFQTTPGQIQDINGEVAEKLEVDSVLRILNNDTLLHVQSVKTDVYTEAVPYTTITLNDTAQYTTYEKVTIAGQEGSETKTDRVIYVNGKEMERTSLDTVMVSPSISQVVIVGTKEAPDGSVPGKASGTFTWPVPNITNVTSGFGGRWGTTHQGLDISGGHSYGETIVAADAGVVKYVKYSGVGYGNHVEIDHGNGMTTLYAHTSEILVKDGEEVAKGQPIALIGSTGDSTGAHLHFEIHVDGTAVDPTEYVS